MYELPLFPLNTVLFPGMPLKLHIFEERYKLMIGRCYAEGQPFGVTLIRRGQEVGGMADPAQIGCTATITEVEPLPDGRMNIVAVGSERFQIRSLKHDLPYLVGVVDDYPFISSDAHDLPENGRSLRPWVRLYLEILAEASNSEFPMGQLPRDPLRLANLACFLLQIPAAQKQNLLNITDPELLLTNLHSIYRREVTLLRAMLTAREAQDIGTFSTN
ncbi:MAG: LON peptidase substrate-binding domain-containing protein [Chloroflexota bacterium]